MRNIVVCFLVLGVVQGMERVDPLVETNQGIIRGLRSDDGDYSMFLGIPFGVVDKDNPFGDKPVLVKGNLLENIQSTLNPQNIFQSAKPHPRFEKTFLAYDDSAICPQVEEFNNTIVGTLDCLHLNIYVPSGASSKKQLPVLVWIYGGGFQFGFAGRYLYGPEYLIRHDVILVTLNYRLGPYGFMCLDTPEVPGNQGLKDQLLALRWINNNIASFGGDVNKVTVMGESAGAASVEYHLWSEQEKLFNQVILQSGSVLGPWAMVESDPTAPLKLAERLGYVTENLSDALSFLAKADEKLVIAAATELSIPFKVCVEKQFENVESVLSEHPRHGNVPKAKNTRILTGYNNQERMESYVNKPESDFKNMNVFNKTLNNIFLYDDDFFEMEDIIRNFYIGDEEVSKTVQWNLVDFSSDSNFIYPIQESIERFLDNGAKNVYHYLFSYSGERNFVKKRHNITEIGAAHADEISYLFDMIHDPSTPTKEDQKIIDILTTLWTNFVKYGEPTPEVTELLPIKWVPVTKEALNYLNINSELSVGKRPYNDRIAFWKLFVEANKGKLKGYNPMVPFK